MAGASAHPLLTLALLQPQLLIDHALAAADLLGAEAVQAAAQWRRQTLLGLLAAACVGLAAGLAGTAVLLWAALPSDSLAHPSVLALLPLLPLLPGFIAWRLSQRPLPPAFALLRLQWADDRRLLQPAAATGRPS